MRGLILFRGLTFRGFGKSRDFDYSPESCHNQFLATSSHVNFVNHLKKQGHEIHVAFDTIIGEKTDQLMSLFQGDIKFYSLKNVIDLDMQFSFYRSIRSIEPVFFYEDYDFFLVIRNDLLIKDKFLEVFNPCDNKLMFVSVVWYKGRKTTKNNPRVNDCIFYFPKRYLHLVSEIPQPSGCDFHNILDSWLEKNKNLEYSFYLNTYHDSNTELDYNPLYRLVNRPESLSQVSDSNLKYPDDF